MLEPFGTYSDVRNVDYLVIGDYCNIRDYVPEGYSYVQITAPNRGYNSAFQILRHTHSILKEEGGTVVMSIGNSRKAFTLFDTQFLHPITIKKYKLEGLCKRSRFPLMFEPIASLRFLWGGYSAYRFSQDIPVELNVFCKERSYKLIYLEKYKE